MKYLRASVGWGVTIYAVMYLLWSGLVIYGYAAGLSSLGIRLLALALITSLAAQSLNVTNWRDALPFAISWAVCAAVLDAIFLVPFSGWEMYSLWSVWVGYALIVVFPMIVLARPWQKAQ